jgi:hypothetical protein
MPNNGDPIGEYRGDGSGNTGPIDPDPVGDAGDPPENVPPGGGALAGPGGVGNAGAPIASPETPGPAGRNIGPGGAIGTIALGIAGRPIAPGGTIGEAARGPGGTFVAMPGLTQLPTPPLAGPSEIPSGQAISEVFNIGGAPIAILGGVFAGGLPIGGPVTQIWRGGSAPIPNTLFISTLSSSGPIGNFFIGSQGSPIGVDTFGGGGLPIGPTQVISAAVTAIQPRTALVTAIGVAFGAASVEGAASPIGAG